jgi:hypothetical protein
VLYLRLIILSIGGDVPIDSEALLVTDFVNLKIKPTQSFIDAYMSRVHVCVHRDKCYEYLCFTMFLNKKKGCGLWIKKKVAAGIS